jgi:hypothetical protein
LGLTTETKNLPKLLLQSPVRLKNTQPESRLIKKMCKAVLP